jgi:hypothetical protein
MAPLRRPRHKWEDNIKIQLDETEWAVILTVTYMVS